MKKITVLLVDDHILMREGLCSLLEDETDIKVVGQAKNGAEAVDKARRLHPDVVVMDIAMPTLNGVEATRQILDKVPGSRVLILSAFSNPACIGQVLALGATGYLEKTTSVQMLAHAIRKVCKGELFLDPAISSFYIHKLAIPAAHNQLKKAVPGFTPREIDVLRRIAKGLPCKQIAIELGFSKTTAEKHRFRLMDKLGIHDTAGLTSYAIAAGYTDPLHD